MVLIRVEHLSTKFLEGSTKANDYFSWAKV
jgi:hypothetical protein